MKPDLTIGFSCGQSDYCLMGYPDVHVFEHTMKGLRKQTHKNFEVVVADVYYEQRKDYFQKHAEDFPVLHVPVKPNIWINKGAPAICATKNTYLMYAKGNYVANLGDCWELDSRYVERLLTNLKNHKYVSHLYAIYKGDQYLFKDKRKLTEKSTWGNLAMSIEDWEELNGYNELYDGAKGLEDCDMGCRIAVKDGNKDGIQLIVPYLKRQRHIAFPSLSNCLTKSQKCVQLCFRLSRSRDKRKIYQANKYPLVEQELKFLKKCANKSDPYICPYVKKKCSRIIDGVCYMGLDDDILKLNNHPSLYFDLKEQRKNPELAIQKIKQLVEAK